MKDNRKRIKLYEFSENKLLLIADDLIRYNNRVRIKNESVAAHSFYVAVNTLLICDLYNITGDIKLKALEMSIIHDSGEFETGDIVHTVKIANPKLCAILDALELEFVDKEFPFMSKMYRHMQENPDSIEHLILKIADTMSVVQYISQELELGNKSYTIKEIAEASFTRLEKAIDKLEEKLEEEKE